MPFVQRLPLLLFFLLGCGNNVLTANVHVGHSWTTNTNGIVMIVVDGHETCDTDPSNINNGVQCTYTLDEWVEDEPQGNYNGSINLTHGIGSGGPTLVVIVETFTLVVDESGGVTLTFGTEGGPGGGIGGGGGVGGGGI
ncbi:MAG: hypothetical protein ABJZ55_01205 [Fuerstiella sp.]